MYVAIAVCSSYHITTFNTNINCVCTITYISVLHGYELIGRHKDQNIELAHKTAIEQDDPILQQISQLCAQYHIGVCVGYIERDSNNQSLYNSAVMYNTDGRMLVNYRKVHLWSADEINLFRTGDLYPVVDVNLQNNQSIKVGINICYDLEFPECARICALQRAHVLFVPTALTMSDWSVNIKYR